MISCNVFPGGLMRCCLATLDEAMAAAVTPPTEGATMQCRYCNNPMIYRRDGWHWHEQEAMRRETS